jgi:hypothetical protein
LKRSVKNPTHKVGELKAASAKMIDEDTDKLPMIPATSVQEIKNQLQPFVEASVDRLIVPYVPVTELAIDDAPVSLKRGASRGLH